MVKYIDAHCHAYAPPEIGVICNATQMTNWPNVIKQLNPDQDVYGAIGIHPWFIKSLPDNWESELTALLRAYPDLMIGEIGLDKHRPDMDGQMRVFERHLDIAHELNRGVCLHCVGAWERVAHILRIRRNALPRFVLAHGYNGPENQIEKFALEYNMYFSYGPRNLARALRISHTPINRILSETDTDNPSGVIGVVNQISEILHIDHEEMADIIYANTKRMLYK